MSEIRRWEIQLSIEPEDGEVRAHITEAPDGYLVLHSYYATERTAREAAEAAVARMREQCEALVGDLSLPVTMSQFQNHEGMCGYLLEERQQIETKLRALLEGGASG